MKKMLSMFAISLLSGVIAVSSYVYFYAPNTAQIANETKLEQSAFIPANFNLSNTVLTSEAPNFVTAAEKTIETVVHVKNTSIISAPTSLQDLFFGRQSQRAQVGTGSGVIISPDGYVVTNNHVIAEAREISITTNSNKIYTATLIGTDPKTDIALLKIEAEEDLPFVTFGNSDNVKIGEWVLAIGNPFNLTSTVTAGIISAKSRDLTGKYEQSFLQTDAAVNPGNSGGALVNINGELIGINTAITSQTGSYIGYSFAVPSNIARKIINDIMEYGAVQNGILGVVGGALNSEIAAQLNINDTEGFYIEDVEDQSGAAKAGLKKGDIIKEIDNIKISKFTDMKGYLNTKQPNDVVTIKFIRDNKSKQAEVTLIKRTTTNFALIGILKEPSKNELKKYNIDFGIQIQELTNNPKIRDAWIKNGVQNGTIVTKINNEKIYTIDDVERIKASLSPYDSVAIEIINKNGEKEKYYFQN